MCIRDRKEKPHKDSEQHTHEPQPPSNNGSEHLSEPHLSEPTTDGSDSLPLPEQPLPPPPEPFLPAEDVSRQIEFYESNSASVREKISLLEDELQEERDESARLSAAENGHLESRNVQRFVQDHSTHISVLCDRVCAIDKEMRDMVHDNRERRAAIDSANVEFSKFIRSDEAQVVGQRILKLRSTLARLDEFMVRHNVWGARDL